MSENISLNLGDKDGYQRFFASGYQVKNICNCRLVFGEVPLNDMAMLIHGYSKKAVMALDIASRVGATLVVGEPADIEELRLLKLPFSDARINDAESAKNAGLPEGVVTWLLEGDRGRSSEAMCKAFFGIPRRASVDHPKDPGDLNRCLQFLSSAGGDGKCRMGSLVPLSKQWAALVVAWDDLADCYDAETRSAKDGKRPKTYMLMQDTLASANLSQLPTLD